MSERLVAASADGPPVRIVVFERETSSAKRPALLWIHGGGYVIGRPEQNMAFFKNVLNRLDIAIVSVDYRLAPEHPFPAPLDDCYAALRWMVEHPSDLAIDVDRIAIGGQSAGGGLAATLVQRVVDDGLVEPVFQLLLYPTLNAPTSAETRHGAVGRFVVTPKTNYFAWASYLGCDPTIGGYPTYAVPAQRSELAGLPSAWIGVGTLDLFHDDNAEYGKRLRESGVACVTYVVEGGYHAFEVRNPKAAATSHFYDSMLAALSRSLGV
nr:alpha/beta hydrolase [Pseudomonas yamanorum]